MTRSFRLLTNKVNPVLITLSVMCYGILLLCYAYFHPCLYNKFTVSGGPPEWYLISWAGIFFAGMLLPILGIVLHYCVHLKAHSLTSCSSVTDVRTPIGCYPTDVTKLTAATFTFVNGYNPKPNPNFANTMERYCGLQCLSLRNPYYILYNDTTCACVNITALSSINLSNSPRCLTACPNTSVSGSLYCPTATPSLGAYWFCTPYSHCNESNVFQGPDVGLENCNHTQYDDLIEGDYITAFCLSSANCLQQNVLLQCVNGSWNSLGQTSTAVCLPCSQYPTVCSSIQTCSPTLPPGTCVALTTTTTTSSTSTTTTTTKPTTTLPTTTTSKPTTTLPTTTTIKPTTTLPTTTTSKPTTTLPTTTTIKPTTTLPTTTTIKPTTTLPTTTTIKPTTTLPTTTTIKPTTTLPTTTTIKPTTTLPTTTTIKPTTTLPTTTTIKLTTTLPTTTTIKPTTTLPTTTTIKPTTTLPPTTTINPTTTLPTTTTSKPITTLPTTTTTKPTATLPTTATTKPTSTLSINKPPSTLPTTTTTKPIVVPPATTAASTPPSVWTNSSTVVLWNGTGNFPWYGGNQDPLPSQKLYTLVYLTNYDSSDRPTDTNVSGFLTEVSMALMVQNIDSISELTSSFGLDMFFYLSWMDPRLNFNNITAVGPPGSYFQLTQVRDQRELWTPPVYVGNRKATDNIDSSKHNSVLFLNSNGEAASMYREFVTVECKMNLQDYPFDTQICPIYLGLFGFYDHQVELNWSVPLLFNMSNPPIPFSFNEKITLPAWTVVDYYITSPEQSSNTDAVCAKFRTCLLAKIVLRRKSSFYIIDTFLPNMIILAGSCLTLWINPENVPARISMAVTLFLTFQATSLNVRSKLPNVTYVKAIDIWLFFGQGCLFCVMAEFLLVHTILNGYVEAPKWRRCSVFGDNNKAVQTEDGLIEQPQSEKLSRQQVAKNIEKVARVLFPTVMILFAIVYFSYYLSK